MAVVLQDVDGRALRRCASSLLAAGLLAPGLAAASPVIVLYVCLGEVATHAGSPGPDRIEGTPGRDVITGRGGNDVILGGDGRDVICGGSGDDRLDGRYGDDRLTGEGGADRVFGGPGDDMLLGGPGPDRLDGGDGSDSDTLVGGGGRDSLDGGDGGSDADFLFGGDGKDWIDGGVGGRDVLYGGPGDDFTTGGIVSFEFSNEPVTVSLAQGPGLDPSAVGEGADRVYDVDGVTGSDFDDTIVDDGETARSFLGRGGADVIRAAGGDDSVGGGRGSDALDGGPGKDTLTFGNAPAGVTVRLGDGFAEDDGVDSFTGFENVVGSFFDDHLTGDEGPNALDGSYGLNTIFALGGDDFVEFADEGDAGEGADECIWSGIPCEHSWHFDPPSLPFVSRPHQGADVDRLRSVGGGIAGGLGGPQSSDVLVSIRRLAPDGCWWWDEDSGAFVRGACGLPIGNAVPVEEHLWRLRVGVPLAPGAYEAGVTWAAKSYRESWSCGGAFGPMCVTFDVR